MLIALHTWVVMLNFRLPFGFDVIKGDGSNDGEANQEDVSLRITQRAESGKQADRACL